MKRITEIKVKITYGSEFQERTWEKAIESMLKGFRMTFEEAHNGNIIDWDAFTK
jgi:hypothetical protein